MGKTKEIMAIKLMDKRIKGIKKRSEFDLILDKQEKAAMKRLMKKIEKAQNHCGSN